MADGVLREDLVQELQVVLVEAVLDKTTYGGLVLVCGHVAPNSFRGEQRASGSQGAWWAPRRH